MAAGGNTISGAISRQLTLKAETTFGTLPGFNTGADFMKFTQGFARSVENEGPRGAYNSDQPVGSIDFGSAGEWSISTTLRSGLTFGAPDGWPILLTQGGFDAVTADSGTVDASPAPTTTSSTISGATVANWKKGYIIQINGTGYTKPHVARLTSDGVAALTWEPAAPSAPTTADTIRLALQYIPNQTQAIDCDSFGMIIGYAGYYAQYGAGCTLDALEISAQPGEVVRVDFSGPCKAAGQAGKAVTDGALSGGETTVDVQTGGYGEFYGPALLDLEDGTEVVLLGDDPDDYSNYTLPITKGQQGTSDGAVSDSSNVIPYMPTSSYQADDEISPTNAFFKLWDPDNETTTLDGTVETKGYTLSHSNKVTASGPFLGQRHEMVRFTTGFKDQTTVRLDMVLSVNSDGVASARNPGWAFRKTALRGLATFGNVSTTGGGVVVVSTPGLYCKTPPPDLTSEGEVSIAPEYSVRQDPDDDGDMLIIAVL